MSHVKLNTLGLPWRTSDRLILLAEVEFQMLDRHAAELTR